ncbi:hypothetical protein Ddye_031420 [Dipteronia dyeriana]|uniref:Uncharacterized protein n=1 Tax=Dipteronia dyeriana TaxID=168575 RepID=A0AAD9TIT8_9ROSI|nr:hypothetical protein Ddye_031420 [Dipteronia dyeriana]
MDEQLASPIVEILLRKLRSKNVRKLEGNIELKSLEGNLSSVRDVLIDAEKQQFPKDDVRGWLKRLKDACYDAEDALEELEIEALHWQWKIDQCRSITRKVCNFISCSTSPSLCFASINSKKFKEIKKKLDAIKVEASKFGFEENGHRKRAEIIDHSSFVVASDFLGRDNDKENIIKLLMKTDDISIFGASSGVGKMDVHRNSISIFGTSGIGKTTLAKQVYEDKRIDEAFNIKMWVCLPHKFFEKKIIIDMIYSATGRIENNMEIDQLEEDLEDILKGQKYLLVLDEFVGHEFFSNSDMNWSKLKSLLSKGASESKIITITNDRVYLSWETYRLLSFLNESNLSLFWRYADAFKETNQHFIKIVEEIAAKCAFHPLVVKILGSILHFTTDEGDWNYVSNNIRGMEVETETLSVLKLGYDLLPYYLKQCFVCCSVFPKGHGFNNITLIQFWMAHGLLGQFDNDGKEKEPESVGMQYINELRWRCLFQDFEQNFDFISFKMHDLVHDLATKIAKDECFRVDSRREYRHLSMVNADGVQSGGKMTRSILFFEMIRPSQPLIGSCISQFPKLRVLDFRNSDMEELPKSIGKLKHLRYLNLTKNIKIKRLPKSIFKLRFLETLLLGGCKKLEELPEDIKRLVNLRMLVFSSKQSHLPENGIGCLTSLKYLGIGSCYNLKNLFNDIGKLQALQTLIIGDCPKLDSLPHGVQDLNLLENLMLSDSKNNAKCNLEMKIEPPQSIKPRLRMLCIDGVPEFKELPQWILRCSANSTLQRLAIKNCPKFEKLPVEPLQILKSLEILEIWNCQEFSSLPEDMHHLTAMRELKVRGCPNFSQGCKPGTEDWSKIKHIPKIELDDKVIKSSSDHY